MDKIPTASLTSSSSSSSVCVPTRSPERSERPPVVDVQGYGTRVVLAAEVEEFALRRSKSGVEGRRAGAVYDELRSGNSGAAATARPRTHTGEEKTDVGEGGELEEDEKEARGRRVHCSACAGGARGTRGWTSVASEATQAYIALIRAEKHPQRPCYPLVPAEDILSQLAVLISTQISIVIPATLHSIQARIHTHQRRSRTRKWSIQIYVFRPALRADGEEAAGGRADEVAAGHVFPALCRLRRRRTGPHPLTQWCWTLRICSAAHGLLKPSDRTSLHKYHGVIADNRRGEPAVKMDQEGLRKAAAKEKARGGGAGAGAGRKTGAPGRSWAVGLAEKLVTDNS
ncbi:hypothetical protein B0H11DRAFT_1930962 [Mycena galericulata]|nr:hypothetical protein B0H11DRAFT_1930962 [Mycena galericulata]